MERERVHVYIWVKCDVYSTGCYTYVVGINTYPVVASALGSQPLYSKSKGVRRSTLGGLLTFKSQVQICQVQLQHAKCLQYSFASLCPKSNLAQVIETNKVHYIALHYIALHYKRFHSIT